MSEEMLPGLGPLPDVGSQEALFGLGFEAEPVAGGLENPVAHVLVLARLPHLSRVFDYEVPPALDATVAAGVRVTVPLASQEFDGIVVGRDSRTRHHGRLKPIKRVNSPLRVATPEILGLVAEVAAASGASGADCLRLAVPARHARAEARFLEAEATAPAARPRQRKRCPYWGHYRGGAEFIDDLASGKAPRAACCALAGPAGSTAVLADAAGAVLERGQGVIFVAPTARQARALEEQLTKELGVKVALYLSADSVETRYTAFLNVLRGRMRVVVGTRSAVWAPVRDLGLMVVIDDAAASHREEHAPYCRTLDVAVRRTRREKAGLLVFSPYLSEESCALVDSGAVRLLEGHEATRQASVPRISLAEQWRGGEEAGGQLPEPVFALVREAIGRGPVLVVVPRSGYVPILACQTCRELAACSLCGGTLSLGSGHSAPACTRCGTVERGFRCPRCGGGHLRAARIGSSRTVHDIARAFPGHGVIHSSAAAEGGILSSVSEKPRIVVATAGAEPAARGGYSAAVIVDARFLQGTGLGAQTRLVRAVTRVAVRVRPRSAGGHLMLAGHADPGLVAAVSTWSLGDYAYRLYFERRDLRLPPAASWFSLSGARANVKRLLAEVRSVLERDPLAHEAPEGPTDFLLASGIAPLAPGVELLGPAAGSTPERTTVYLRADPAQADALGERLQVAHRSHCAAGFSPVRIALNPLM